MTIVGTGTVISIAIHWENFLSGVIFLANMTNAFSSYTQLKEK
jgi:hypothetical protein